MTAASLAGDQTFESFEPFREPAAYLAVRDWVEACQAGAAKLALLPQAGRQSTGCGKTHLLRAAANELALRGERPALVSAADLTRVVRGRMGSAGSSRPEADLEARRWAACRVLLFDGLGLEEVTRPMASAFLVNLLEERGEKPLALASSLCEEELSSGYGAALVSRILGGASRPALVGKDFRRGAEPGGRAA